MTEQHRGYETRSAVAETAIEGAIQTAIEQMKADAPCEEGITGLATQVFYSKFHFSREFRRVTGTTPRRFLAAVRMHQAKTHLLCDDVGIAQVSNVVGYSSVGTFSTRFTELVGVPPREWRTSGGRLDPINDRVGCGNGRIQGRVRCPGDMGYDVESVFVGAYPDRVLQGSPVACTRADIGGPFQVTGVPAGRWVLICHAEGRRTDPDRTDLPPRQEFLGYGFVEISDLPEGRALQIDLHPRSVTDPPAVYERTGLWSCHSAGLGPEPDPVSA